MLKGNEQAFMYACMEANEEVKKDIFHIRFISSSWFKRQCCHHIETSPLICRANQ